MKSILEQGVRRRHFPGAGYAIVKKEKITTGHVGFRQTYGKTIEANGHELYDVASLTKVVVTTTLIMQLIDEKRLSLDTRIPAVIPSFRHEEVTVEQLLTHTSGLPADIPRAATLKDREDVLLRVFASEIVHPGRPIVYSDIGFILLGLVIERILNIGLDRAAQRRIFQPLGMVNSTFNPDPTDAAPTEYRHDDVYHGLLKGLVHDEKAYALGGVAGHAGLFTTPYDLGLFIRAILEKRFVLSKKPLDALFVPRVASLDQKKIRAYGWDKPTLSSSAGTEAPFAETILHTGFTGCNMWIDRKNDLGFVLLSNAVHPERTCNGIAPYRRRLADAIRTKEVSDHAH
ncbi:MAG: serine hydrolase domain-containing protein [Acholeplasmataceae bacterium]